MKKVIQLFLLSALLLTAASCGDSDTPATETKDSPTTNVGTETAAPDPLDFIPADVRYEGETFTVLNATAYQNKYGHEVAYLQEDIVGGDIVAEAVYERNMRVSDRLGVKIEAVEGSEWDTWIEELALSIQAGDNAYDAICGAVLTAYNCIPQGYLYNLKDVSSVNLSSPWWDQTEIAGMTFLDGVYTLAGDINFYDNYGTSCMFFNVEMCASNDMELPYQAVRDGTWTFDMLNGMVKDLYQDLNGDGKAKSEDMYGMVSNAAFIKRMLDGLNFRQIVQDDNNYPVINESEAYINAITDVLDLMQTRGYYSSGGDGSYADIFTGNRALFSEDNFAYLVAARDIDAFTIGILPYPKYDEKQENYCCPINEPYSTVYGIPTTANAEMVGYVLEAMGAASVDTVTEAVIEKNCMVKSVRDEDSVDMIRIILNSAAYPLATVTDWGNMDDILMGLGKNNTYASKIARQKSKIEKIIATDLESIKALQNS